MKLNFEKDANGLMQGHTNGLRYLRWGGDGEAVQPEKCSGVENCLGCAQTPQRQVHALLGCGLLFRIQEFTKRHLPEIKSSTRTHM